MGKLKIDYKESWLNAQKRIEELERKLEQTEKDLADYQFNYPKIKELEKENAELKVDNAFYEKACEGATMMYKHLIKAKELLAKWVELFKPKGGNIPPTPTQVDTEQYGGCWKSKIRKPFVLLLRRKLK